MPRTTKRKGMQEDELAQSLPKKPRRTTEGAIPLVDGEEREVPGIPVESHLKPSQKSRPNKKNVRQQNLIKWSKEEKEIIYLCYQIARNEIWGRGKMKQIFTLITIPYGLHMG